MSMRQWERDIIEYRPTIGLDRHILTRIMTRVTEEEKKTFQPTAVVVEATNRLGIDLIDNMMANLSEANRMLQHIESSFGYHPTFQSYKEARQQDEIRARERYEENLTSIEGIPELDVYPILLDLQEEMESYIDYLNQELFDGRVDYSDSSPIRKEEEQQVMAWLDAEAEDLAMDNHPTFTPQQTLLIERMIQHPDSTIKSEAEYIRYLQEQRRKQGSPKINYDYVKNRVQQIAVLSERVNLFRKGLALTNQYLTTHLQDFVHQDIDGTLSYLVEEQSRLSDFTKMLALAHRYYADQSLSASINMKRVADRDVREMLDQKMADIKRMRDQWKSDLSKQSLHIENEGASSFREALDEGIRAVDHLWTYILTEQIGTSELVEDQFDILYERFLQKKRQQSLYQYADLVRREFDFDPKLRDRELQTFNASHSI